MDESLGLNWEDTSTVIQTEEVVCNMENEILTQETEGFGEVANQETVAPETEEDGSGNIPDGSIMYLTDGNVIVMQQPVQENFDGEGQVVEEVITDQWAEECPEEIVVGSEEAVGDSTEQTGGDCDIPLPTDQDEYTAARPYPCDFCSRRFRKKANLMNHMVAHQTDRPHECNLCGIRYVRKCDLINHLKIHAYMPESETAENDTEVPLEDHYQKKQKPYTKRGRKKKIKEEYDSFDSNVIASSSKSYSYSEDINALDSVDNDREYAEEYVPGVAEEEEIRYPITDPKKPFVCQHCGVGFAREKALASHSRIHGGDSPFECQKCGEMFWDLSLMKEHVRSKHGDMEYFDDDEDEDYSEQDDARYGTFYCTTCGLSFHRQDNLRRHQRVHVKEEYESEFGHICNVCGESFQEALDLLAHAEIHARGIEHRCMICGEVCPDEKSVAAHVQSKHGKNLPPNTCMTCGRTCRDGKTLQKHQLDHLKDKSFDCSKCEKSFHSKAGLKRHMLSHRSKTVICDVCGEEFPDGRSLMNHRHSHSSVSGNKFPCRECGKTFGSRSSQQIHIRIHTGERPYGCRFCWKAFADGGTLRKHERIHTGEKPYACAVCPRAFNQRVVLREHIRSHHSGPDPRYSNTMTPFCCTVCSDMFTTSQDLILHLIHHCDMNTAMKRQPQERPRKYKRRRKLKPHELELISNRVEPDPLENADQQDGLMMDHYSENEEERVNESPPATRRSPRKASSPVSPQTTMPETFTDMYDNATTIDINTILNKTSPSTKLRGKKLKLDSSVPSRPKMIHTQKTRVPVEKGEDGRVRHRTKTLVTRTQPAEIKSNTGERIRPRTKNVNYHVLNAEKLPLATFPDNPPTTIENLVEEPKTECKEEKGEETNCQTNGDFLIDQHVEHPPEVAAEQTVETDVVPVGLVEVRKSRRIVRSRNVIGPGSKVRLIKEGMIVSKLRKGKVVQSEPESILPDVQPHSIFIKDEVNENDSSNLNNTSEEIALSEAKVKQEFIDPSPLHELAEISMQHANSQNLYKCEMCSEVFTDRAQLLVHVPIHI